jgi:hypothetical protein
MKSTIAKQKQKRCKVTEQQQQVYENFHQFLRDNRCVGKFILNVMDYHHKPHTVKSYVEEALKKETSVNLIQFAFHWAGTEEGADFWATLSVKWNQVAWEIGTAEKTNIRVRAAQTLHIHPERVEYIRKSSLRNLHCLKVTMGTSMFVVHYHDQNRDITFGKSSYLKEVKNG